MTLVAYGAEGRPIQRVADRLVQTIETGGRRASAVSAADLPGVISRSRGVQTIVGAWWRSLTPVLGGLPKEMTVMACLYDHETWKAHPEEFLPIARRASVVFACNGAMRT